MRPRLGIVWPMLLGTLLGVLGTSEAQPQTEAQRREALLGAARRVVLPERCGECHRSEFEVWESTAHATGFETLHRSERAKAIYQALGLRLIKRGTEETTPACLQCHYTPVLRGADQLRAGAGVSCESCHGPAADWIDIHNDYGVREPDFQKAALLETPEHETERVERSRQAGMRRPSDLYDVAANCFACHTVPNEELVNRAGHSTGSDFELVAWSQGDIRHNFLESFKTGDGRTNAERSDAWKRTMYVVGRALEAEYSLRGVAVASADGLYLAAMSDRVGAALDNLLDIDDRVQVPEVRRMIEILDGAELRLGNREALLAAADGIGEAARRFIAGHDADRMTRLDPLWNPEVSDPAPARAERIEPSGSAAPASPAPGSTPAPSAAEGRAEPSTVAPSAPGAAAGGTPASAEAAPSATASPGAEPVPSPSHVVHDRPPWMPEPAHAFVRKVPCARCHNAQEKWWRRDPHSASARPFRADDPANAAIARNYGISPTDMGRADRLCMSCHGTAVTATSRNVRAGVGCQRCHGPGADYEAPHEESYTAGLAQGLVDLKNASVRAEACAACHYVTDPGLVEAGHPSGSDFDFVAGVQAVRHWGDAFGGSATDLPAADLAAAYRAVAAARGPLPVRSASAPPIPSSRSARTTAGVGPASPVPPVGARDEDAPAAAPSRGGPSGAPGGAESASGPGGGPPVAPGGSATQATESPEREIGASGGVASEDAASLEELLLDLKRRLESVYERLGRIRPD